MKNDNYTEIKVDFLSIDELMVFIGKNNNNIKTIESMLDVEIIARGNKIYLRENRAIDSNDLEKITLEILQMIRSGVEVSERDVIYAINLFKKGKLKEFKKVYNKKDKIITAFNGREIYPKTLNQKNYIKAIEENSLVFGIGPAGTGKTYLAVILAVKKLKKNEIKKIILARPAVEAGENLGFLPGDLKEKVDPYLRPLYDALYDSLGHDTTEKYIENGVIEIAPLAYMRGRTLDNAYIILDEAQNTTNQQMKMFLTRLGVNAKMIVNGDISQIDLPKNTISGLVTAVSILKNVTGIEIINFENIDIIRHPLVQKILDRYDNVVSLEKNKK